MKRILFSVFLVVLASTGLIAQRRNGLIGHRSQNSGSVTLGLGPAYCYADPYASVYSQSVLNGHNYQASLGYLHFFSNKDLGFRAQLQYANFAGSDLPEKSHDGNHRFYSYVSNTYQFSARAEYGLTFGMKYRRRVPNTLYGFLGAGAMMSESTYPDNAAKGKLGSTFSAFIPLGVGYKYEVNSQISIGAELSQQILFSDLIDGYEGSHIPGVRIVNDNIGLLSFSFYYKIF